MPTDRMYWLIAAHQPSPGVKYFVSNPGGKASQQQMLQAAFARWQIEKWFEWARLRLR